MSEQQKWLEEYMAGKHHPELRPVWDSLTPQQQKEILAMMDEFGHDRYMAGFRDHRDIYKEAV